MSLLMGALGGLGAGLSGVASGRIQNIDQRALEQMQQQMEIAKEQRIEEMQKAREQRGEAKDIRSETRALTNAELARKAQFEFETNPENVNLRSEADVAKQRALDEYKYATQGQEAGYQKAMAEAKYGPMYEARAANVTRQGTSAKLDKAIELQYKHLIARADASRKAADNEMDEVKQLQYKDQAMKLEQAAEDLLTSAGSSGALPGERGPSNKDPLGLRSVENTEEKVKLIQQLKDAGATLDFRQEPDTATLKAMLADMQVAKPGDKVDRALGADYGYGKRADGTNKGKGFLGELKRPDGGVSTEISVGVNIGGKEMDIPTLVPTLTKQEVDLLLAGGDPTEAIIQKAVDHAKSRLEQGKSPFAQAGEEPRGILGKGRGASGRARAKAAERRAEEEPRSLVEKLTPEISKKAVRAAGGILSGAAGAIGSSSLQRAIAKIENRKDLTRDEKDAAIKRLKEQAQ